MKFKTVETVLSHRSVLRLALYARIFAGFKKQISCDRHRRNVSCSSMWVLVLGGHTSLLSAMGLRKGFFYPFGVLHVLSVAENPVLSVLPDRQHLGHLFVESCACSSPKE